MNRDNQQVRDICWLAGVIDGEGCFYLQKRTRKKAFDLIPEIIINNSNWLIIENIDRVLKENKIGHFIFSIKGYGDRPGKKPKWGIRITGLFRCKALLVTVLPYLCGKNKEAEVLHHYICSRLEKPNKQVPYDEDEKKAYEVLRMLKQMSNPNDYTLNVFVDKMKI